MARTSPLRTALVVAGLTALVALPLHATAAGGTAKGTLLYNAKAGTINASPRFAYLVKGPDAIEPGKTIRKLILSETDLGAKISACATMSCTDADLTSGMTVEIGSGARLNYWVSLNGQRVQYSGTTKPDALASTADTPQRLAGRLAFDGTGAGGPKVDVEFDAPLVKELAKAR